MEYVPVHKLFPFVPMFCIFQISIYCAREMVSTSQDWSPDFISSVPTVMRMHGISTRDPLLRAFSDSSTKEYPTIKKVDIGLVYFLRSYHAWLLPKKKSFFFFFLVYFLSSTGQGTLLEKNHTHTHTQIIMPILGWDSPIVCSYSALFHNV